MRFNHSRQQCQAKLVLELLQGDMMSIRNETKEHQVHHLGAAHRVAAAAAAPVEARPAAAALSAAHLRSRKHESSVASDTAKPMRDAERKDANTQ